MDLGSIAASVLRAGALPAVRDERITISLRMLDTLLDGRLRDNNPELARAVGAAGGNATLILPAGTGPARIDVGGRQFVLPQPLRDALLAVLNDTTTAGPAGSGAAVPVADKDAALRLATQALVAAAVAGGPGAAGAANAAAMTLAASGALRVARNKAARPADAPGVPFDAPVFDAADPETTATRLAARVNESGVFFEAHVAQSLRGERTAETLGNEAQQLIRLLHGDPARTEARTATQLDVLARDAIALAGPAWPGQPMRLELSRELQVLPDGAQQAATDAAPLFAATLQMDLPRLGRIEIRLRLAGVAVAATVQVDETSGALAQAQETLPAFAAALGARGLHPVLLQAIAWPAAA